MIGTRLGPYEIRQEIGRGGMATVYRAHQPNVDRDVAIKVIHRGIAGDPAAVVRFQREAKLIARLEHPHILPIYDFDGAHDPPYIVMRYLDGGTLKDVMAQGLLPLDEVTYLMRQMCAALDYAHRQNIIHRDIKPSNIMIDREGNAFVADLGIARIAGGDSQDGQITATGAIIGTPDYMCPEQATGIGIDHRADIYALGVMLYEMLTGNLPYQAETAMGMLMMHMQQPVPSAVERNPALPLAVDAVIAQAMAKDATARYATVLELSNALTEALGGTISTNPSRLREVAGTVILRRLGLPTRETDPQATPAEQNKPLVAMYINAAEYAEMVEQSNGSEAARRALAAVWTAFEREIGERGGLIHTRTEGDMLVLWGVESAQEEDAERAVHTALRLQAILRELGAAFLSADETLPLNIGIHSGITLLTPAEKTGSYSVSGTTISLANRLMQNAVGTLLISHDVFRQVVGVFTIEQDEPLKVRGRKDALATYRVLSAKPRAFRLRTRGVEGIETKLIAREAELKQLQKAFFIALEDGETQVVTISAEAGIGKSRLLGEFDLWAELRPEAFYIFNGRVTASMTDRPYALIRDMLSLRFELQDNDAPEEVMRRLESGVAAMIGPNVEIAHLMGYLCGFDFSASPYIKGILEDPAQLGARARQLFVRFFMQLAQDAANAVVILLEDIHHADDASLDLLNELFTASPNLHLLIVCTARPVLFERRPTWGSGQDFHTQITLKPLDKRDSRDLAAELLQKIADAPKVLRDLLVERAEGNPYFMEELVKMLLDDRVILKESDEVWRVEESRLGALNVPATLLGLLEARLDTLLYPEKLTLQRAAVIGRTFWDTALLALDAADDTHISDLTNVLKTLAERDFIYKRETTAFEGGVEYTFAGNMLRDAIYNALLRRQRETFHHAVGAWLETATGARALEFAPLIADHYEKAGEPLAAAQALLAAGERSAAISAYRDAHTSYARALALLEGLRQDQDDPGRRKQAQSDQTINSADAVTVLRTRLLIAQGAAYLLGGLYTEGYVVLDTARPLAEAVGGQVQLQFYREWLATLNYRGDFDRALAELATAQGLAEASGDPAMIAWLRYQEGSLLSAKGDHAAAQAVLEALLPQARALGDNTLIGRCANILGIAYSTQEKYEQSNGFYQETLLIGRRTGDRNRQANALLNLGENHRLTGDLDRAEALTREALGIAEEIAAGGVASIAIANLGLIALGREDWANAQQYTRRYLQGSVDNKVLPEILSAIAGFAQYYAARGDLQRGLALAGLARNHPAADFNTINAIDLELLPLLRATLSAAEIDAGMAAGTALDLEDVVRELLGE